MAESSLHAAIKSWYAQPGDSIETLVDGYIINDIRRGELLIEIQTRSFSSLRPKLETLLSQYPVHLVHPIAVEKWIIHSENGRVTQRRKSPKHGRSEHMFKELVYIPHLLFNPNFTLQILYTDEEETWVNEPMPNATPSDRPPRGVKDVLEARLFEAVRFYVRVLDRAVGLQWEEWGRRRVRHGYPLAGLVHQALREPVARLLGQPVRPSYVFLASYPEGGFVPPHTDRRQCRYTLDLCVDASGPEWPLFVDGVPHALGPNEALLYLGCEQQHWREPRAAECTATLAFFHFVDPDFEGPLE